MSIRKPLGIKLLCDSNMLRNTKIDKLINGIKKAKKNIINNII